MHYSSREEARDALNTERNLPTCGFGGSNVRYSSCFVTSDFR